MSQPIFLFPCPARSLVLALSLAVPSWAGAQVHVSSAASANDGNAGTAITPLRTLAAAATRLKGQPGEIRVAVGRYEGSVTLPPGTRLSGGYSADFSRRAEWDDSALDSGKIDYAKLAKTATLLVGAGPVSVRGGEGSGETTLARVVIVGPDRGVVPLAGGDSIALLFAKGHDLVLEDLAVVAGNGAAGLAGKAGVAKSGQYCGQPAQGGTVRRYDQPYTEIVCAGSRCWPVQETRQACDQGNGADGSAVQATSERNETYSIAGGSGGHAGESICDSGNLSNSDAGNGSGGNPGNPGDSGRPGISPPADGALGYFTRAGAVYRWTAPGGQAGASGGNGSGGGGGGGGGSRQINWAFCKNAFRSGQSGGNGGRGGCGGEGGGPGDAGGSSVAILLDGSRLTVRGRVHLWQGQGGTGGSGGAGAAGSPGEGGGSPVGERGSDRCLGQTRRAGEGATGGTGGPGGVGGEGAGGAGGASIGIAYLGDTPQVVVADEAELRIVPGIGGRAGAGGAGGVPGLSQAQQRFELKP